jgi:tetratricopeptide (TPR) repeat protein
MKIYLLICLLALSLFTNAQVKIDSKDLTADQQKALFKSIQIDSSKVLSEYATIACKCIDSISTTNKGVEDFSKEIAVCIDKQVQSFDMIMTISNSLQNGNNKIEISLNNNKKSDRYIITYRLFETWLRDSCTALKNILSSNNVENEHSISKIEAAKIEYQKGNDLFAAENYKAALPYFEKAVKIDPNFVFAWDNIGVCCRRIGEFDKAIYAYKQSLKIDPKGLTPLHNLPVVYEYLKDYDKAIETYKEIEKIYPNDPEAFFGAGRIFVAYKKEYENGLDKMCVAYNLYTKMNSPYRVDAEKVISIIFSELKKQDKEALFYAILKTHNITPFK